MILAIMHKRTTQGWAPFKSAPLDSFNWDASDREWFEWMIAHASETLTIGDTMYELTAPKKEEQTMRTIDITPTWTNVLPILIAGIEAGNEQGRAAAIKELSRMAQAADAYYESTKGDAE